MAGDTRTPNLTRVKHELNQITIDDLAELILDYFFCPWGVHWIQVMTQYVEIVELKRAVKLTCDGDTMHPDQSLE
jgi:chromatin segregation and condensation protein Rec8/ScpA/Scc1 (kleisin family)